MKRTTPLRLGFALVTLVPLVGGCRVPQQATPGQEPTPGARPTAPPVPPPQGTTPAAPAPTTPPTAPVAAHANEDKVLLVEANGKERWLSPAEAQAGGYTIVDLGDDWTPFIFAEQRGPNGEPLPNRYRRVFVGLGNDQLDEDGQPLPPGRKNYLELYGIFPTLSVLRSRFVEDAARSCHDGASLATLEAVDTITYIPPTRVRAEDARIARLRQELEQARRKLRVDTLAALAEKDPKQASKVKLVEKRAAEKTAMVEVERRLGCEGFLGTGSKHAAGIYDDPMQQAVRRFQQKHMIYESHYLRRQTMDALSRPLLENDRLSLLRTLRERVVSAAEILEDGSMTGKNGPPTFVAASGEKQPIHNLADEYADEAARQLGVATAEGALAFFQRHAPEDFKHLKAAIKLPARPEYYGPNMDLSIVIDRGDVWYDLPWDAQGNRVPQPRKKFPSFTLNVKYRGQTVPLVRWRTTIGGWRAEQAADGYEYFRYKGSDVGPRVIRNIVAGPVWIAPASTPIRSLIKTKAIGKTSARVVNYDELGPGYLSAYGLVAGYFVVPGQNGRPDWDNGIRAHGSSEYLSMYSENGFSHGCHRLPNHLAIRLYSFILRHRPGFVRGDLTMDFSRQFLQGNDVFELRIPSRGYSYQLEPPLPVDVLEGEIKGELKEPVATYVPKPGVQYPGPPPPVPDSPEARAGGGPGGPPAGAKGKRRGAESTDEEETP